MLTNYQRHKIAYKLLNAAITSVTIIKSKTQKELPILGEIEVLLFNSIFILKIMRLESPKLYGQIKGEFHLCLDREIRKKGLNTNTIAYKKLIERREKQYFKMVNLNGIETKGTLTLLYAHFYKEPLEIVVAKKSIEEKELLWLQNTLIDIKNDLRGGVYCEMSTEPNSN